MIRFLLECAAPVDAKTKVRMKSSVSTAAAAALWLLLSALRTVLLYKMHVLIR